MKRTVKTKPVRARRVTEKRRVATSVAAATIARVMLGAWARRACSVQGGVAEPRR